MASALLRLFIAVELAESTIRHIDDIIDGLRQQILPGIRWVRPEGIHLTLKFLGNTPDHRLQAITTAMREASAGVAPFVLHLRDMGAFPNLRTPRVLWMGSTHRPSPVVKCTPQQANPDASRAQPTPSLPMYPDLLEPLTQLKERLEKALESQGFSRDRRAFSPHLTLGRVISRLSPPELARLAKAIDTIQELLHLEIPVATLSLIESHLTGHGAVYRRKAQIHLE